MNTIWIVINELLELGLRNDVQDFFFGVLVLGIKVELKCAFEHSWILWDHCDSRPEIIELELTNIYIVDLDVTFKDLYDTSHGKGNRTFASSSTTNDTDLLSFVDLETQLVENHLSVRPVFQRYVFELDLSIFWPIFPLLKKLRASLLIW